MQEQNELIHDVSIKSDPVNILIVDDRPENLLTLESIIEREGRQIIKASHGNEALKIAIRENIGLIMLDIQMPDIDGIEVARLLRTNNKTKHIPIIFVSAISSNEKASMQEFEEGTVDFLMKPLDVDETRSKVALRESMYRLHCQNATYKSQMIKCRQQLDQFVYIVSHDLKAPLRAIENLSCWISADISDAADSNIRENLMLLENRVGRMKVLLDGILEYSRAGNITEPVAKLDMGKVAHAVFEALAPPAGFTLVAKDLPAVHMEPARLYKIFDCLLSNCIRHHHDPGNGNINILADTSSDKVIVRISDNGPGIKPQYAEKVFDLLHTLHSRDDMETAGVGLTIARKLLCDAGQRIWIDQQYENGTSVLFTLNK